MLLLPSQITRLMKGLSALNSLIKQFVLIPEKGADIHTSNCEVSIYSFDFMSVAAAGVVVAELTAIWVGVIHTVDHGLF
ncbi:hypothetical protein QL285_042299 [Trifolium repens]|nr:hypothetical protein QL285_042299 [Trifolium repens]